MTITTEIRRVLGTMIVYGYPKVAVEVDLAIAARLGARVVEVLPDWRTFPDPIPIKSLTEDRGLSIQGAHGCWGGQAIRAQRVDLGSTHSITWSESVDDLKRCIDWVEQAGGSCLILHPGGLSDPSDAEARRAALMKGLSRLADHASRAGVTICVENMPPGVFPGSRMADLRAIVEELDRAEVALTLDTGHARISSSLTSETVAAGARLRSTHVHDNDGRQDRHLPPGSGSIEWDVWVETLDAIDYRGTIMLECIKQLRDRPGLIDDAFLGRLRRICRLDRS